MDAETGIGPIGTVGWGTHFCHFYRTAEDLAETLVPFFKAGLERNEACLWVTAAPFDSDRARSALNLHIDELDRRIARGQIAICSHEEWYARHARASHRDVAQHWLRAADRAQAEGYSALRLSGNTGFLGRDDWDGFMDYELSLREAFGDRRLLALCSYDAESCDANAVLDVVQAHDFALARRRGSWEMVENAALARSKAALAALNAELENRVSDRARELSEALAHQQVLTAELSHRVKNTIAAVQAIVDQSLRSPASLERARQAVRGRLHALAQVHDQLAATGWQGVRLREVLAAVLQPYGDRIRLDAEGQLLTPRAALDLSLLFHELATNAAAFGSLGGAEGVVELRVEFTRTAEPEVRLTWRESGGPPASPPEAEGFGLRLVRQVAAHNLRGACDLAFERSGLTCRLRAPAKQILAPRSGCGHVAPH